MQRMCHFMKFHTCYLKNKRTKPRLNFTHFDTLSMLIPNYGHEIQQLKTFIEHFLLNLTIFAFVSNLEIISSQHDRYTVKM